MEKERETVEKREKLVRSVLKKRRAEGEKGIRVYERREGQKTKEGGFIVKGGAGFLDTGRRRRV